MKVSPPERLVTGIRTAAAGEVFVDPAVTRHLLDVAARRDPVGAGLSNAEVAARLVVSETTVKTHVARLLPKLGVRDRLQAVVWAHAHGIAPQP